MSAPPPHPPPGPRRVPGGVSIEAPAPTRRVWLGALRVARGRYVANLDDDDAWEPDFLATLVPILEEVRRQGSGRDARS